MTGTVRLGVAGLVAFVSLVHGLRPAAGPDASHCTNGRCPHDVFSGARRHGSRLDPRPRRRGPAPKSHRQVPHSRRRRGRRVPEPPGRGERQDRQAVACRAEWHSQRRPGEIRCRYAPGAVVPAPGRRPDAAGRRHVRRAPIGHGRRPRRHDPAGSGSLASACECLRLHRPPLRAALPKGKHTARPARQQAVAFARNRDT